MAYSDSDDVKRACGGDARYVQAFDWNGDRAADLDVVATYIAEADATINTYAVHQFAVPVDPVPEMFKRWSAKLAVIYCRRDRGGLKEEDRRDLDQLLGTKEKTGELEKLGRGEITPGLDPIPTKGPLTLDEATPAKASRDVSRAKLRGFW